MNIDKALELRAEGKQKESNEMLLKLWKENPMDANLLYQVAWSFDLLEMEREAIPYYEKAISLGLSEIDLKGAYLGLGSTLRTIGEYEHSRNIFLEAIRKYPKDNAFKVFYAMTLYNLREYEASTELLLNLLADTSSDIDIIEYQKAIKFYANKLDRRW